MKETEIHLASPDTVSHRTYIALVVVQLIGDVHKSQTGLSMFNYNISALVYGNC